MSNNRFLLKNIDGAVPVANKMFPPGRTKRLARAAKITKPRWLCRKTNELGKPCLAFKDSPGKECWCVGERRRKATFEWRPNNKRFLCHCGEQVDTCSCPEDNSSPGRNTAVLYDEDACPHSGIPVAVIEPGCKTYAEILFEVKYELENLQFHYYPYCQDGHNLPLDARFEMGYCEGSPASGGAAGGAADSAAKSAEKAPDVINLVSSDDEKEAGMSP